MFISHFKLFQNLTVSVKGKKVKFKKKQLHYKIFLCFQLRYPWILYIYLEAVFVWSFFLNIFNSAYIFYRFFLVVLTWYLFLLNVAELFNIYRSTNRCIWKTNFRKLHQKSYLHNYHFVSFEKKQYPSITLNTFAKTLLNGL